MQRLEKDNCQAKKHPLMYSHKNIVARKYTILTLSKLLLFFGFLAISLTISFCEKTDLATPEPIKERIASYTDCTCEPYIDLYSWKGQKVYLLAFRGPACNWVPGYFNEEGQPITMESGYSLQQFAQESKLLKRVWTCQ